MSDRPRVRIGIDVGGTFTHAVAVDALSLELLGKVKTPTTHHAAEGVARGVIQSLTQLMRQCRILPEDVLFIAHSTTQATNALLEGDVAAVGIVGMGEGASAWLARRQTRIPPIELGAGRCLRTSHAFLQSAAVTRESVLQAIDRLVDAGAEVIVAAEAFAVDQPAHEQLVCELAMARGLPATATHHVSRLHGLRVRTRTAVINASMIPRMLNTAEMTERAVREAGIRAPLMVMRSDGGVMSLEEMRARPILTMLSGPAAGVAAALLFVHVSDGIFLEVGGTSTDISVIKDGRCRIRSAEIGGQKLHVSTLDVRTVGVAGGSLACLRDGRISRVGPRSAHIAGLPYLSFAEGPAELLAGDRLEAEGDAYAVVKSVQPAAAADGRTIGSEELFAVTPTCASNLLGLVPSGDPAEGNAGFVRAGFAALAQALDKAASPETLARSLLDLAVGRIARLIEGLIRDYQLDRGVIRLVGGGGGASAIVPALAARTGLPFETCAHADVVSAIGVALAMVRDTVERTAISPTEEDIRRIRQEALDRVLRMGAAPESIEVYVEVDTRRNLLRATAEGSTEAAAGRPRSFAVSEAERSRLVAASMGRTETTPECISRAAGFEVWEAAQEHRRLWGLRRGRRRAIRVLDAAGAIRWQSNRAEAVTAIASEAEQAMEVLAERHTRYTDAGTTIPRCFVLLNGRLINLAGLVEMKQVLEVLRCELSRAAAGDPCVLLVEDPA